MISHRSNHSVAIEKPSPSEVNHKKGTRNENKKQTHLEFAKQEPSGPPTDGKHEVVRKSSWRSGITDTGRKSKADTAERMRERGRRTRSASDVFTLPPDPFVAFRPIAAMPVPATVQGSIDISPSPPSRKHRHRNHRRNVDQREATRTPKIPSPIKGQIENAQIISPSVRNLSRQRGAAHTSAFAFVSDDRQGEGEHVNEPSILHESNPPHGFHRILVNQRFAADPFQPITMEQPQKDPLPEMEFASRHSNKPNLCSPSSSSRQMAETLHGKALVEQKAFMLMQMDALDQGIHLQIRGPQSPQPQSHSLGAPHSQPSPLVKERRASGVRSMNPFEGAMADLKERDGPGMFDSKSIKRC
eukprot:GHVN01042162.1.p1 GENE.GHVN01042162.1~~GHVN01042162.1.p1  ORF type:complete len:358 (-),score=57.64 GHVN01042162.1:2814-3887(-)